MTYAYKGRETFDQQLAEAKAAAQERQRAVEEKTRQLGELRAAERMAHELAIEEARLNDELHAIATGVKLLPPPIYGGQRGLHAATEEIAAYNKRKRARTEAM